MSTGEKSEYEEKQMPGTDSVELFHFALQNIPPEKLPFFKRRNFAIFSQKNNVFYEVRYWD